MTVIVDYRAGNLTSVQLALAEVGESAEISADAEKLRRADRVIFPGVGAAGASMQALTEMGLVPALQEFVASGRPFLGICVGCQILLESSLEDDGTPCLGLIPGTTGVFAPSPGLKVPHMGWNPVQYHREHPVFAGIPDGSHFYFVHSYYPKPSDQNDIAAHTRYGGLSFASILAKKNLVACQFHAEKSGQMGLRLLKNFTAWDGKA